MTAEGIYLWLISIVLVPLIVGQLRRFAIKVSGRLAAVLATVVSVVVAFLVLLFYGQLHLSADPQSLGVAAVLVFGLATFGYKLLYGAFSASIRAALVG